MSAHDKGIERLAGTLAPFLRPDFFFVNVGACDGVHADPIYPFAIEHGWSGLAVEPVPYVFAELETNYAALPGVTCLHAMIGEPGTQTFWYVRDGSRSAPWLIRAIGSSSRQRVLDSIARVRMVMKAQADAGRDEQTSYAAPTVLAEVPSRGPVTPHEGPLLSDDVEDFVDSVEVESIPFNECMDRHDVARIDLLNIDAEGFDYEIIRSIDMERFCPSVLVLETSAIHGAEADDLHRRLDAVGLEFAHRFGLHSEVYTRQPPTRPGT